MGLIEDEIQIKLYGRQSADGKMELSHAIINGQRYYPEELSPDIRESVVKLLVFNHIWPFEYRSP